ncbi:MAG TPA: MerR family transcriptional regulator [Thermomicrobiales bacterium]|jgi:hypothetical protein|nr:MerR family transcriptional regulator [Thermomicrobiales bacterium]
MTDHQEAGPAMTDTHEQDIPISVQVTSAAPAEPFPVAPAPRPQVTRLYMTSDLRAATGLARTHMDFYLREGLIQPTARTESGYLLFDDAELATLRQVIGLRQEGLGIRDIRDRIGR